MFAYNIILKYQLNDFVYWYQSVPTEQSAILNYQKGGDILLSEWEILAGQMFK